MPSFLCPKGHQSTEPDYCSECGAKIVEAAAPPDTAVAQDQRCPKCGTPREDLAIPFCEACGYNFVTGSGGAEQPIALPPEPAAVPLPPAAPTRWALTLAVDPSLREPGSPEPPADFRPFTFTLDEPSSLIGRKSVARAINPEIPLTYDDAVSHRHALLQLSPDGQLQLRDIGSSNGTRLNGVDLKAMVDTPLKDGDEITLGHWSRISVKAIE
jgi:ribosomal protein L37AE/L43A